MSDFHVTQSRDRTLTVVMHFPVPGGNNDVGVAWQQALLASGIGGTSVLPESALPDPAAAGPGEISSNELAAIQAGTIYEHVAQVTLRADMTNAQRLAAVQAAYTREQQTANGQIADRLRYFGFEGDMP